jgi:hypothetical protein
MTGLGKAFAPPNFSGGMELLLAKAQAEKQAGLRQERPLQTARRGEKRRHRGSTARGTGVMAPIITEA